jgi:two-component system, NarL family, invasion response regulator UvrY
MNSQLHESGTTPVGVMVVDDQVAFREAAREVVEATPDFVMLGEAASGEQAIASADELHPDLVLVDVRMAGMDGIATTALLHSSHPTAVVVLISVEEPQDLPGDALSCGAAETIRKQDFGPATLRRVWGAYGPSDPEAIAAGKLDRTVRER